MAIINDLNSPEVRRKLEHRLRAAFPGGDMLRITDLEVPPSGLSFQTLKLTVEREIDGRTSRQKLVARVEPLPGAGIFREYDLEREVRVLQALQGSRVPVPRIHFYEAEPTVLGAPFAVMEHLPGRAPADSPSYMRQGWVLDLSPDQRRCIWTNALRVVADLHAVDWEGLGLDWLARPELGLTPVDQQIAYYEWTQAWGSAGHANPTVDATFVWLKANRPSDPEPVVLAWGDAKPGNMLYADNLTVAGALDFEMAALASPELDLGWWLFAHRYHAATLEGGTVPSGILSREEVIDGYQEMSGHEVRHAFFYEVLGGLRVAVLADRGYRMMMAAGLLPPDHAAPANNAATQALAAMLDLPAPDGINDIHEFEAPSS
ncbi:phosphotransferase family protein (plasmid) [Nocardioides sp. R1-1]|uniref:phosphotransferase family protein n=1 Tax=Nocardioides sp. R1-1 TaxID=3383502 RepID=UPI0038D01210